MQASPISGNNADAQITARSKEVVKVDFSVREREPERVDASGQVSDPVDIVSISNSAHNAYTALSAMRETLVRETATREASVKETSTQSEFKEWARGSATKIGAFTQRVSGQQAEQQAGQQRSEALTGNGLSVEKNESVRISVGKWGLAAVAERSAEKARDVRDLLNSTPRMENWGLLLAKLPIDK